MTILLECLFTINVDHKLIETVSKSISKIKFYDP